MELLTIGIEKIEIQAIIWMDPMIGDMEGEDERIKKVFNNAGEL